MTAVDSTSNVDIVVRSTTASEKQQRYIFRFIGAINVVDLEAHKLEPLPKLHCNSWPCTFGLLRKISFT
jgi:hypothetical protein